jgi:hypothetical protein
MLEIVVKGTSCSFSALLVQPHPSPASLHELIFGFHRQDRADAGEAVSHAADQSPVAQTQEIGALNGHAVFIDRLSGRNYCLFEGPQKSAQLGCRSRIRRVFGAARLLLWPLGMGGGPASEAPPYNERLLTKS